ncbi:beta-galactosidase trimerization domain-containing protein [Paenibacillus ferrarius]|uniref:beta-galactosidase trimerization domain-containing protein n=1 Tax=Paenibacillus ferrarius TaxID=1469647 RepID=UPI003D2956DF
MAEAHPEWLVRDATGRSVTRQEYLKPFYRLLCMNSPYLDVLIAQIEEVVANYDGDGIFLDIVGVKECYCHLCIADLRRAGKDPRDLEAVRELGERVYANYTRRVNEAVHRIKPDLPIFHNGGHIRRGRRDFIAMNTHLELESLPTGGYGYDHFPISARYVQGLNVDFLGMTGKFHTHWGEFGGYKHPNALRYETAVCLANGARCSVGDQLHPQGQLDQATYTLIGQAYAQVELKEPWCRDTSNVADIGVLSLEAVSSMDTGFHSNPSDLGVVRILQESHYLFDFLDLTSDFTPYRVLILPDAVAMTDSLLIKLDAYLQQGGKVLATGRSGLREVGDAFALDLGVRWAAVNPYQPAYFKPDFALQTQCSTSFVVYAPSQLVELSGGQSWGNIENPYYNRDLFTYCSHQHFPTDQLAAAPGIVESEKGMYICWPIFEEYATVGSYIQREIVQFALSRLLPNPTLDTNLPSQGIVTLQQQVSLNRSVVHLLYASPVRRGKGIEVIEDLPTMSNVQLTVQCRQKPASVYLAPQMAPLSFHFENGKVTCTIPELTCHQMVVLQN